MDPWVVLKKQYLDEKCLKQLPPKDSGPSIPRSNVIRNDARVVYGTTGGFSSAAAVSASSTSAPYPPYKPYVPSASASYDEVCKQTAAAWAGKFTSSSSSSSSASSLLLPMTSSTYGSSSKYESYGTYVNSSGSGSGSGAAVKTHFLDGQGWYNQVASRAVNQAIGRVIRHKKDWGAIFLLDDRFQYDKQVSQLSSWVRPRLKKYAQFPSALSDFRRFITTAMADPDLKIPVPVAVFESRTSGYLQSVAVRAAAAAAATAAVLAGEKEGAPPVMRVVAIRESDLSSADGSSQRGGDGDGEGDGQVSYIDPALLLTQPVDAEPSRVIPR